MQKFNKPLELKLKVCTPIIYLLFDLKFSVVQRIKLCNTLLTHLFIACTLRHIYTEENES